jgi:hypothetical protein
VILTQVSTSHCRIPVQLWGRVLNLLGKAPLAGCLRHLARGGYAGALYGIAEVAKGKQILTPSGVEATIVAFASLLLPTNALSGRVTWPRLIA